MKKILSLSIVIVLAVAMLCSCYQQEKIPMIVCSDCSREFPEEYAVRLYSGDLVCNGCAQNIVVSVQISLKNALEDLENEGVYLTDYDFMMVATAMCNNCGNWAPAVLYDMNDEHICFDCINEAIQNKNVAKALNRYFEYG